MHGTRVFPLRREVQVGYFAPRMTRHAIQQTTKTIKMPANGALEEIVRT